MKQSRAVLRTRLVLLRNNYLRDLAEIVLAAPNEQLAREGVWRYLDKLPRKCPTEGCAHEPSQLIFICDGYSTTRSYLELVDGVWRVKTEVGRPFVIDPFCRAQGIRGRCGECKERNFCYRRSAIASSIYCHGCGFFVDFPGKQVGFCDDFLFPPFADTFGAFRSRF